MAYSFNDSPIEKAEDDKYGITTFARLLAKSIRSIKAPVGTTIALNGQWGSGKSSAVNIIRSELETAADETLVISDFKCWWYRGEEALVLAFLQNLNALLDRTFKDKVKELVPQLGQHLLQAGPVIGSALALASVGPLATLADKGLTFIQQLFPEGDTLENTFRKLAQILEGGDKQFLIIIDDIDRLSPEEALAIFRMVKSVGCLPNVIYLLVFDRVLAEKVVAEHYPSEGPHFLEKIIQASFELPVPLRTDIKNAIFSAVLETCGNRDEMQSVRFQNIFHDVVAQYLTTPRHVVRFQHAINVTWPAIEGEISLADFVALETLRLYEPSLFQAIRSNKSELCRTNKGFNPNQENQIDNKPFLKGVKKEFHHMANSALQKLFPLMENIDYSNEFLAEWDAERRVCVEENFDTYLRLVLSDEKLPMGKINELIEKADDRDFIQSEFRKATASRRRSGTSMIPVLFDELHAHAPRIPKEKVEPLLSALFEIHDEVDLEIDVNNEFMVYGDTTLRYHWLIRRLTTQRFTLEERTNLYMVALQEASLGWLVNFVHSAKSLYSKPENKPLRDEDKLVRKDAIDGLVEHALKAIRLSAIDGSLLEHQDLLEILYWWRDFLDNDPSEVHAWTKPLLENDAALVIFARMLTGETLSQYAGELTPRRSKRVQIDEDADILDVGMFLSRLKTLQEAKTLGEKEREIVEDFLDAWHRRKDH